MSGDYLSRVHDLVQKRKKIVIGLLGVVIVSSIIGLKFVKYNNDIEIMLPQDADVQNTMHFLREANFSDKLVISLKLNDELHTTQDLILASDQLAASIRSSPLVKQVISNVSAGNVPSEMISFLEYAPQLLGPESLSKIDSRVTPENVKERLKFIYRQSLSPGSSFLMPFLRVDPLGLFSGILHDIEHLSISSSYDVVINNNHLISRDGRHAMVIVKTPVTLTEGFGARKLVAYLLRELKIGLPEFISGDIIAGHMHTVSNEDVIKKDIRLTSIIASFTFLALFLFFFRDIRAVMIFLAPLAAVAIAINITYLVFKNLSYSVIGMGTVISGISIDYGIYVYMAVRKAGGSQETIRRVIRPVIFSALTTIGIFSAFFFSSIKGYHQLAFFSNLSIILCLMFSLFILPHFLSQQKRSTSASAVIKPFWPFKIKLRDSQCIFCWVAILAIMLMAGTRLRVNNDLVQFDGVSKEVVSAEEDFHNVWGGKVLPAVLVVPGKTLEDAYQNNADIYETAIKNIGKDKFTSFASVWPGPDTRKANVLRWQRFWSVKLEGKIRNLLTNHGKVYNFSQDAFQPFFQLLHSASAILQDAKGLEIEPKGYTFFDNLKEQYVVEKGDGYQVLSFFPDEDKYIARLSAISKGYLGAFIVSRKNFSNIVSHAFGSELILLSVLAVFLTAALTFLLVRNIHLSIIVLVPVITSIIMIAGVITLAGLAVNISIVIASMIVIGIVSDYGMFVVHYCRYEFKTGTYPAVTFAAVTTFIGAGALLFAHHPILFSVGVTMVTGVLSGYLASVIVIPALYRLWIPVKGYTR
ncbi:MAG: MMPL family transporter [Candidatus Omnitrophica bacterium]|nr:MMPL family transporter [Candidatus Omnitrophota bacterium]